LERYAVSFIEICNGLVPKSHVDIAQSTNQGGGVACIPGFFHDFFTKINRSERPRDPRMP